MDTKYSEQELGNFLDYTIEKGLLNESTARARKIAAQRILAVLDDNEKQDLRTIDLDSAFQRFANKNARDFTPQSLASYRSRLKSALEDFSNYVRDPAAFRTTTASRSVRKSDGLQEPSQRRGSARRPAPIEKPAVPDGYFEASPGVVFPIPLRSNLVVQIHGLPSDLTQAEADRIAAVVRALAVAGKNSE
jgi:hypothetical protein